MEATKDYKKTWLNILGNVGRYALYFLLVILTPLLSQPMAGWFETIQYNQIEGFFVDVCASVLWLLEFIAIVVVESVLAKRARKKSLAAETFAEPTAEVLAEAATADASEAVLVEADEPEEEPAEQKKKSKKLSLQRVGILTAIALACVLIISAQINFQVKPFYDIGEKITSGYDLLNQLGGLIKNIFKCLWIVLFVRTSLAIAEDVFSFAKDGKWKPWATWLLGGALVMAFGIYDVIASANPFAWTYILFYAVFTLVYYLTDKSAVKSGLLIFFIYIF